jgi:hypothetical protein
MLKCFPGARKEESFSLMTSPFTNGAGTIDIPARPDSLRKSLRLLFIDELFD